MAEFVKVCPRCHRHNPDTVNSCLWCPSTLAGVEAEDPDAPPEAPGLEVGASAVGDAAQSPALRVSSLANEDSLRLELARDPSIGFVVRAGETAGAPGHTEEPDVALSGVPDEDFISGCHVRILRHGPDWFVQHVGHTNYIVVDGVHYTGGDEVPVTAGSSLFLTHTEFIVRGGDEP